MIGGIDEEGGEEDEDGRTRRVMSDHRAVLQFFCFVFFLYWMLGEVGGEGGCEGCVFHWLTLPVCLGELIKVRFNAECDLG